MSNVKVQNNDMFDNIKKLSNLVQDGKIFALANNVKHLKNRVEGFYNKAKSIEYEYLKNIQKEKATIIDKQAEILVDIIKQNNNEKIAAETVSSDPKTQPKTIEVKEKIVQTATTEQPINNTYQQPNYFRKDANKPFVRTNPGQNSNFSNFKPSGFKPNPNYQGSNYRTPNYQNQNNQRSFGANTSNFAANKDRKPFTKPFGSTGPQSRPPFRPMGDAKKPNFGRPTTIEKPTIQAPQRDFKNKNKTPSKKYDEKKSYDKRTLLRRGLIEEKNIEDRMLTRIYKIKKKKSDTDVVQNIQANTNVVITTNNLTVKQFSELISKPVNDIIKKFMLLGNLVTINSLIDFESAELVADEFGIKLEQKVEKTGEQKLKDIRTKIKTYSDDKAVVRPPIVTIMGHVDHGKTSLLDYIRNTHTADSEAGGITQKIGAYRVKSNKGYITFVDTPGHEAFTAMRLRGAMLTDLAILIVAADDGIMPQTVEAIRHIKAAGVPFIVAINKIDKPAADSDKILQQLTEYDIIPEAWGGDTIVTKISAKTGEGIDKLLDLISLLAEMQELKANPNAQAIGSVLESKLDIGKGPVATVIVKDGTLRKGDMIVAGLSYCRVKSMIDENSNQLSEATPSMAVSVVGFNEVPVAGEQFTVIDEKLVKQIIEERRTKLKIDMTKSTSASSLEDMMQKVKLEDAKTQNLIIKADLNGSLEALKQSLIKLSNDKARINILSSGVGGVSESDLVLAEASNSIIIAFNTKVDSKAKAMSDKMKIKIKSYKIIYEAIEEMDMLLKDLIEPTYSQSKLGEAEVKIIFKLSTHGVVAGSLVKDGKIVRNEHAKIIRNGEIIADNLTIVSIKVVKDDVKEVGKGFECGIKLSDVSQIKEGDIIECYTLIKDEI